MNNQESYEKEFAEILSEAIEHFDPSAENDVSMFTIVADIDNNQLIFGGLKLREDLEEEDDYNEDSQVFYTAKSKSLKKCYNAIEEEEEEGKAAELLSIIGEAIDNNEELEEKFDGLLLYGWCKADGEMIDVDNFWA